MKSSIKILVVEDNEVEYEILLRRFRDVESSKYELFFADSFKAGCLAVEREKYDVFLVDYFLEGSKTGIDFITHAREKDIDGPFIILTGTMDKNVDEQGQLAGADDFLLKSEMTYYMVEKAIRYALERKRNQALMISQQMKMHQYMKISALGELAAGIAHEINNPVAIICALSGVMKMEALEPKQLEKLEKIEKMALRVGKIIKSLQAVHSGQDVVPVEKIKASELVEDCLVVCAAKLKHNDIELRKKIDEDLQIECRPSEISQVLVNLISNAADAVEDLPSRWLDISVSRVDEKAEISITDSGQGIEQEVAEKLWQPFFSTKERKKGMGLGMSIVKSMVEAHNGKIFLNSKCMNTQFILELPLVGEKALKKSILVVEDEPKMRELMCHYLDTPTTTVFEAKDGESALMIFSEETIDVVVTDINMPGVSGTALCNEICQIVKNGGAKPKLFVVSGSQVRLSDDVMKNLEPQILQKPFDPGDLVRLCLSDG